VFSSWPSTWTVLSSMLSCSEIYRRFTGGFAQEQGLVRAFCTNSALYAKPVNALSSKVFSEVVDLASGDVVQSVRTLPCHSILSRSLVFSITCSIATQSALSPGRLHPSLVSEYLTATPFKFLQCRQGVALSRRKRWFKSIR